MHPSHPKTTTQPLPPPIPENSQHGFTPATTRKQDKYPNMEDQKTRPTTSKTTAKIPDPPAKQRQHSISTSSDDMEEFTQAKSNNEWQMIRRTKRKRLYNTQLPVQIPQTEKTNRFSMLTDDNTTSDQTHFPQPPIHHKPPPIFIHGVLNYTQMIKRITEVTEEDQYFTKSLTNNVIKLTCKTPDTYRSIVKHFKKHDIYFHTYQLKEERAFRVFLKFHRSRTYQSRTVTSRTYCS
jgi:hypothetical protein